VPRLSIVIPVLGDPRQLDDTLLSVLENRPANCEILVVHNEPYHDPYHLSDEVRFVEAERGAGMVACINRGLTASQSPVVHLLACGVEVSAGWADAALRHFGNPEIAAVGGVLVDRADHGTIVSAGLGYRPEGTAWRLGQGRSPSHLATCQQDFRGPDTLAAFYRKSSVEQAGGFSTWAGDALAGIDLALVLWHSGFRCVLEPQCVAKANTVTIPTGPAFRHGRHAERLFWRWASSHGWFASLLGHVALLAGQCVIGLWRPSMFLQLAGRAWGLLSTIFARRRPAPAESAPVAEPSVVAAPHFAQAHLRETQRSSRVA
jgi:hypothetical protein